MVELQLTEQEQRALQAALEYYVRELRGEARDTDARGLREELEAEGKTLRGILDRLTAATKPR